ncbi:unnamed protein product [Mytilus edulis]|uniref:Uncharacterized protein n=1 Tax=Mytilus edulis TaxID=6550 RepID=A0A8S3TUU8_MYTED|nr:unnamed protein product [Mytilus edulis]
MSTNTPAAQELLRLFKCIVLTGTPVLTNFAKDKLLPPYNGNFDLFLEDKKHEIFHLWQSQKLLCCACPPSGCYLKRTNHMVSWIFKKMYDDNGPENRGHIVRHKHDKRKIVQVCLHKFVKRHIPIHELDISVVSFLLRNLANLSPTESTSLDIITTRRSEICHAHAMNCYPMALLNTAWNELENALLDLADPSYKPMIRCQIKNLRQIDLEKEEITDILSNIEKVSKEVKASFNNNVDFLINMENRFENKSIIATERPVLWQLGTPQHWNLDAVEAILSNPVRKDETFKMKFVKKGSLIMLTTIAASVLSNSEAFEAAIFSFLTKVIEDCDINTEIPGRVDVTLHILNDNEGIPSKMTEFEKCDVAFLNGDDEQEIEWVHNMSSQLKAKFDLNCAILAKDCLNGFPLRKSLGKYFDICQAVIVTLTKDNYGQYDFYVADDMPVIAVELDYVNEIRLNLRKCPYIDCTTCEDLWFPQFIDIIKVKLPGELFEVLYETISIYV